MPGPRRLVAAPASAASHGSGCGRRRAALFPAARAGREPDHVEPCPLVENSMILRIAVGLLAALVAGCAARPLPVATGPVRQLNVGKWVPGPGDLDAPPAKPARAGA